MGIMHVGLKWTWFPEGIEYTIEGPSGLVPVEQWGRFLRDLAPAHRRAVAFLLRYLDDPAFQGAIVQTATPGLLVEHSAIAKEDFPSTQVLLPPAAPVTILIDSTSAVTSPNCRISWRLMEGNGRILVAPTIRGCLIDIGRHTYVLKDPLYSLIRGIEAFNAIDGSDTDARMLKWGELVKLLPEDAQVSSYLKTMRVTRASSFRLELCRDGQGEVSFDPILVGPPTPRTADGQDGDPTTSGDAPSPATRPPQPLMPPKLQDYFNRAFRRSPEVRSRYLIDTNTHVVLEPTLVKVLQVVRAMQRAPVQERLNFLRSPHAYFRQALEDAFSPEEIDTSDEEWVQKVLDEVFDDTGYGDRVRGIGLWQPKVLPWLSRSATQWLPDGSGDQRVRPGDGPEPSHAGAVCGLLIGGELVAMDPTDLPHLLERVVQARAEGEPATQYHGVSIPATPETEESLRSLLQEESVNRLLQKTAPPEGVPGGGAEEAPVGDGPTARRPEPLVLQIHDNLEVATFEARGCPRPTIEVDIESELMSSLKPHQREGLRWLQTHWQRGSRGALLADDMGLGKTLQALAFLRWVQRQLEARPDEGDAQLGPFLIVAPAGLLANWLAEHEQHLKKPGLGLPLQAYGSGLRGLRRPDPQSERFRTGQPRPVGSLDVDKLYAAGWVLTTYETLRDYHMDFAKINWSVIVFDEAQRIKDPQSLVTNAAKAMQAEFCLCLTGTPVENRLADFWCIVDTAQPGLLKDLQAFVKTYEAPAEPAEVTRRLQELRRRLDEGEPAPPTHPKVMLRRIKHDHLEGLPPRTILTCPEPMPPLQAERYAAAVAEGRRSGGRGRMLEVLHQLKQISLHPLPDDVDGLPPDQIIDQSARFRATFRILEEIHAKGEKALIFIDDLLWIERLRLMVQDHFQLERMPLAITGNVSGEKRKALVDELQTLPGFQVLFMTPRAGGVGLTVTAANHVIHLSRWWNPAVEDQATDRVYRIGQTRPVFVYYPLAIHPDWPGSSFDERLHEHLERKRSLSRQLLLPGQFSDREVAELFDATVGPVDVHPTR